MNTNQPPNQTQGQIGIGDIISMYIALSGVTPTTEKLAKIKDNLENTILLFTSSFSTGPTQ